jgi:hypothetical protein
MSEANGDNAQELAERAGTQAKHAAKNTGRAAKAAAKAGAEEVVEEARDAADKLEDTADDVIQAARRVNVGVLGKMSSDTGVGFLALSVCIYSGVIAYTKFRQAASGGSQVIS